MAKKRNKKNRGAGAGQAGGASNVTVRPPGQGTSRNARRRRRRRAGIGIGLTGPLRDPYLLCMTDPFHPNASGARVPAFNGYDSAAFSIKGSYPISSDANGAFSFSFAPRLNTGAVRYGQTVTAGTIDWATGTQTTVANYSSIAGNYTGYRIVQYGIQIKSVVGFSSTSGRFWLAHIPDTGNDTSLGARNQYPVTSAAFDQSPMSAKFTMNNIQTKPAQASGRMVDVTAVDYRNPSVTFNDGWADIVVLGAGFAASTVVLEVDVIWHCEGCALTVASGIPIEKPRPYDPGTLSEALNISSSQPPVQSATTDTGSLVGSANGGASWFSTAADVAGTFAGAAGRAFMGSYGPRRMYLREARPPPLPLM
jgi:hypothetical protein